MLYESRVVLHILQAQLDIISNQPDAWVVSHTVIYAHSFIILNASHVYIDIWKN